MCAHRHFADSEPQRKFCSVRQQLTRNGIQGNDGEKKTTKTNLTVLTKTFVLAKRWVCICLHCDKMTVLGIVSWKLFRTTFSCLLAVCFIRMTVIDRENDPISVIEAQQIISGTNAINSYHQLLQHNIKCRTNEYIILPKSYLGSGHQYIIAKINSHLQIKVIFYIRARLCFEIYANLWTLQSS